MTSVGELIDRGRTSEVYAYGLTSVVKVLHHDVPADWAQFEANLTRTLFEMGAPVPEVRDLITVEGRPSVVFERIVGPSMWQSILDQPSSVESMAEELTQIQKQLSTLGIPPGIPDFVDRLRRKIHLAKSITAQDRADAATTLETLPRGASLLHGDMHPGNILLGDSGPIVIDWFDAAIGHPIADIIRSSLLMRPGRTVPQHLPGATRALLAQLHHAYLNALHPELTYASDQLARWQGVIAVGRLSERADVDESGLIALWESRSNEGTLEQLTR